MGITANSVNHDNVLDTIVRNSVTKNDNEAFANQIPYALGYDDRPNAVYTIKTLWIDLVYSTVTLIFYAFHLHYFNLFVTRYSNGM